MVQDLAGEAGEAKLKVSVTKREDHRALLEIEVEAERLRKELEAAYRRLVRQVDVPGFRRGKAPRLILERHVGRGRLLQQALDRLLPEAYREAVREAGVDVIGEPQVSVRQAQEGKPLLLEIKALLRPEAEIESWDDIVVDSAAPQVTEAEIEEQLERLRRQHATLVSVENGEARLGDQLVVDWQYEPGEDAKDFPRSRQGVIIPIEDSPESTEGLPAEVVAALVGAQRGESRELGGYRVTIREVKRPELAELTDEFARQLGKFD
ncbi:MAG: trigger factor, partial [Bacillota bacterium]